MKLCSNTQRPLSLVVSTDTDNWLLHEFESRALELGKRANMPENIRFGHALRIEGSGSSEEEREMFRELLSIFQGETVLRPREPIQNGVVFRAESLLGVGRENRPIYAFVGDLHHDLGTLGLIIARSWGQKEIQGLTRCDSGGLTGRFGFFQNIQEHEVEQALHRISTPETCSCSDWHDSFAQELRRSYSEPQARHYVNLHFPNTGGWGEDDPRSACIEEARREGVCERRLWMWEIRVLEPPSADEYVALILPYDMRATWEEIYEEAGEPELAIYMIWERLGESGIFELFRDPRTRSHLEGVE